MVVLVKLRIGERERAMVSVVKNGEDTVRMSAVER